MASSFDVCIRGGGIVGRTLALHLAAKRLRVALYAPATAPRTTPDVRAYALNSASRGLLEALRCWPDAAHATPVTTMLVQGDDGASVQFSAAEQGVAALNWMVDVPALEALLQEAVRFQPQIELVEAPAPASLTVVCEGRHSATRDEFGVHFDTAAYGQHALATRVLCEKPHAQVARQWFGPEGEILGMLPLDGVEGHECAIVWSAAPERVQGLQDLDDAAFCEALQAASHNALGQVRPHSVRASWMLQHALAERWSGHNAQGAWVLAGDAAHNVHPLAGQGLNLGLGDVAELVRVLDTRPYWRAVGDPKLLRAYERARKAEFALVGGAGDGIQRLFAHAHPAAQALRNAGMQGFNSLSPLKKWVTQHAMGLTQPR